MAQGDRADHRPGAPWPLLAAVAVPRLAQQRGRSFGGCEQTWALAGSLARRGADSRQRMGGQVEVWQSGRYQRQ